MLLSHSFLGLGVFSFVRTECNKVLKMNLFTTYFTKSVRLEDFEQTQMQASDQVKPKQFHLSQLSSVNRHRRWFIFRV